MIYYEPIWKQISYKKYKKLTKGLSEIEILFDSRLDKRLKYEVRCKDVSEGIGLFEMIKSYSNGIPKNYKPENYDYFIKTGKSNLIFMGSKKQYNEFTKALNMNIKNNQKQSNDDKYKEKMLHIYGKSTEKLTEEEYDKRKEVVDLYFGIVPKNTKINNPFNE